MQNANGAPRSSTTLHLPRCPRSSAPLSPTTHPPRHAAAAQVRPGQLLSRPRTAQRRDTNAQAGAMEEQAGTPVDYVYKTGQREGEGGGYKACRQRVGRPERGGPAHPRGTKRLQPLAWRLDGCPGPASGLSAPPLPHAHAPSGTPPPPPHTHTSPPLPCPARALPTPTLGCSALSCASSALSVYTMSRGETSTAGSPRSCGGPRGGGAWIAGRSRRRGGGGGGGGWGWGGRPTSGRRAPT